MVYVEFASSIRRHAATDACEVEAETVAEALGHVFVAQPTVRGYVLDDRGHVRKHVIVFINNEPIADRASLTDRLQPDDHVYVFQALSGG